MKVNLLNRVSFIVFFCFVANISFATIDIPFEVINGLIVVEAKIDGTKGKYVVDSGSNGILLNNKTQNSNISYQTLSTTLEGSETKIESFVVGDFKIDELFGFSTDLSNIEVYLDTEIAGILGCSIFTPNSITIDFSNSKLVISDHKPSAVDYEGMSSVPYKILEDIPLVEVNVEGKMYTFILDTGASSHFIDSSILDRFTNISTTGVSKNIVTAGGENTISTESLISDCSIGNHELTLKAFEKDFSLISETIGTPISGLISLSTLSSDKVFFDLKSKKLYFK